MTDETPGTRASDARMEPGLMHACSGPGPWAAAPTVQLLLQASSRRSTQDQAPASPAQPTQAKQEARQLREQLAALQQQLREAAAGHRSSHAAQDQQAQLQQDKQRLQEQLQAAQQQLQRAQESRAAAQREQQAALQAHEAMQARQAQQIAQLAQACPGSRSPFVLHPMEPERDDACALAVLLSGMGQAAACAAQPCSPAFNAGLWSGGQACS